MFVRMFSSRTPNSGRSPLRDSMWEATALHLHHRGSLRKMVSASDMSLHSTPRGY